VKQGELPMANRVFKFLIVALLSSAFAQAQEAHPLPRHPGDIIKFEIKFDGLNAGRIKSLNAGLSLRAPVAKDQAGFRTGFGAGAGSPSSPDTFRLEFTVPDNAATGDYYLNFSAIATEGSGDYSDGQEFNLSPIRVENSKTFTPPGVTVKQLP
jgi:hypothetical protein